MINDYNTYRFNLKENLRYLLQGSVIAVILGYLFYQNIIGIFLLSPIIYFYRKRKKKDLIKDRKWKLNQEFRDGILALSASLEAGYSTENAFEEACKDLRQIYSSEAMILREFSYIINQIRMNITVEKALNEFGERTGIEDIKSFSEVFHTAKRAGGDLIHVIKITSNIISDKIEVKREIITLIAAKRLEANIMKAIPLFILVYLLTSSPGFLDPLYHNVTGIAIMTVVLFVYLSTYAIIDKIIAIEV